MSERTYTAAEVMERQFLGFSIGFTFGLIAAVCFLLILSGRLLG